MGMSVCFYTSDLSDASVLFMMSELHTVSQASDLVNTLQSWPLIRSSIGLSGCPHVLKGNILQPPLNVITTVNIYLFFINLWIVCQETDSLKKRAESESVFLLRVRGPFLLLYK